MRGSRIPDAKWASEEKPKQPLGSVPTLDIDGARYCQSQALARYCAGLNGNHSLYPDGLDRLRVDEIMCTLDEIYATIPKLPDAEAKKKARREFQDNAMKRAMTLIDTRLGSHSSTSLTIADLFLHNIVRAVQSNSWDYVDTTYFDGYTHIMATVERVRNHPKIIAFYRK